MLALEVQVEFAEILVKLRGKQATVSDLSQLLYLVRLYKKEIPDDIKLIMLSIPNIVLRDNCELKSTQGSGRVNMENIFQAIVLTLWSGKINLVVSVLI